MGPFGYGAPRADDLTHDLSSVLGIEEQLRRLLAADTLNRIRGEGLRKSSVYLIVNNPGATKLYGAIVTWCGAVEILIIAGAATARVRAANAGIKNIKRVGRGFCDAEYYVTRLLLAGAGA